MFGNDVKGAVCWCEKSALTTTLVTPHTTLYIRTTSAQQHWHQQPAPNTELTTNPASR